MGYWSEICHNHPDGDYFMSKVSDVQTLGAAIRKERKRQELTQVELAALSGVGVRFLRELEHGKLGCQLGHTFLVLNTLGITITADARSQ